jgi:hypothetical protein
LLFVIDFVSYLGKYLRAAGFEDFVKLCEVG